MARTPTSDGAPFAEGLRDRGKRRRTERILEAARELLREQPSQGITIPRLAERAEVSPGTLFNLIGPRDEIWAALADHLLGSVPYASLPVDDPQARARGIVEAVVGVVTADAPVFRALIAGWSQSGRAMAHDPTSELVPCFAAAAQAGEVDAAVNIRRLGEAVSAGLIGTVHQWAAGLIGEEAMRDRAVDLVDIAFAAARPSPEGARPRWNLDAAGASASGRRKTR